MSVSLFTSGPDNHRRPLPRSPGRLWSRAVGITLATVLTLGLIPVSSLAQVDSRRSHEEGTRTVGGSEARPLTLHPGFCERDPAPPNRFLERGSLTWCSANRSHVPRGRDAFVRHRGAECPTPTTRNPRRRAYLARSMYSPVRESTQMRSPVSINGGTRTLAPVSRTTSLSWFVAVAPLSRPDSSATFREGGG